MSARQVSQCLFICVSLSIHTHTSASSFPSPCARYVYVPSLCVNESAGDLTRKKTHTQAGGILTGGSGGTRGGKGEEEVASPSLSSLNPTLLLLSFGSIRPSVLSVSCRSMRCCLSASALLLSSLSLRSILFLPHRIVLFLSRPILSVSSPRSSFQVLGRGSLLRSLLREYGELNYLHMSLPPPDPEAYLHTQPRKHPENWSDIIRDEETSTPHTQCRMGESDRGRKDEREAEDIRFVLHLSHNPPLLPHYGGGECPEDARRYDTAAML
ncbi:NGFI-A-binding protein 2 [Dissostichus eleginoides]|uniref:NGFI-A-binding protein 2 n=1 Tax=Dissostichus eleginoides TaxID=100907 RepID=A0AAD9EWR1_DISEL|nr:NGFI-A-binding protein 2 [Dissostichus eleginoides]